MSHCSSGETNFILVNRDKLLDTAFDELKFHSNYRASFLTRLVLCVFKWMFNLSFLSSTAGIAMMIKKLLYSVFYVLVDNYIL